MLVEKKYSFEFKLCDELSYRHSVYTKMKNTKDFRQWWMKNWRNEVIWTEYHDCMSYEVYDAIVAYAKKSPNRVRVEEYGGDIYVLSNRKVYLDLQDVISRLYDRHCEYDEEW